jgi:NAD-dependent deacetylase
MLPDLDALLTRLDAARSLVVVTGAGVSAASGVPTFRGRGGGLWRQYRPEQLATPQAFARDPRTVWEWYDWRRTVIAGCVPNAAHEVLARWSARRGFTLVTQNVDGLHERAGTHQVIRFHGSIWELRCTNACGAPPWEDRTAPLATLPPACHRCGGLARPGVVWFGEAIESGVLARSAAAAAAADVFLSVGTSSVVYPAAGLLHAARMAGAFTAEINPDATDASGGVDVAIAAPAEEALPAIDARLRGA